MKNVMGIINLNGQDTVLEKLTQQRPLAAVPVAGKYRLIDFVISNMVNAGIHHVGVLAGHKYSSLTSHLRSGKDWDLDRKREGLFILPPADGGDRELDNFYANMSFIRNSLHKYVLIAGGNMLFNIDFGKAFEFHQQQHADITILYKEEKIDTPDCTMLETDADGRVTDIKVNSQEFTGNKVSLEMYFMEKQLLIDLVDQCVSRGRCDLVKDGIIKNLGNLKIYGYPYDGYLARINSVESYYKRSMDLLQPEIWQELFMRSGLIYTSVKDEVPAKYKEQADVRNSLVANGCIIEGRVENSILFRGVRVHKGAYIRDSIIMQRSVIEENAIVKNTICDKNVRVTRSKRLRGDKSYPIVITKGTVI